MHSYPIRGVLEVPGPFSVQKGPLLTHSSSPAYSRFIACLQHRHTHTRTHTHTPRNRCLFKTVALGSDQPLASVTSGGWGPGFKLENYSACAVTSREVRLPLREAFESIIHSVRILRPHWFADMCSLSKVDIPPCFVFGMPFAPALQGMLCPAACGSTNSSTQ